MQSPVSERTLSVLDGSTFVLADRFGDMRPDAGREHGFFSDDTLWSGILDDGRAATIAERLLNDELYSGWGVRTLATGEAGYNPLGYHTGTVWPHDNSLIAAGLARYGHHEAAGTIASAILAAAPYFEYRLPEVFAGFPRPLTSVPVAFPTASRPQAWAAGAPLLLLTTLLHLRPGRADVQADLPETIGHVAIRRQPRHAPSPPAPSTV